MAEKQIIALSVLAARYGIPHKGKAFVELPETFNSLTYEQGRDFVLHAILALFEELDVAPSAELQKAAENCFKN